MKPGNVLSEYARVMRCIDIDEETKQRIIKNCARRATLRKIKFGKFRLTAVKKDKTADEI